MEKVFHPSIAKGFGRLLDHRPHLLGKSSDVGRDVLKKGDLLGDYSRVPNSGEDSGADDVPVKASQSAFGS